MRKEKRQIILSEKPERISVVKVFHLYESRNEWVNWNGDTDLVNRTWHRVYLTLNQAEMSAENQRKQGSKFIIEEMPAIQAFSKTGFIVLAEVFSNSPMQYSATTELKENCICSMGALDSIYPSSRWTIKSLHETSDLVTPYDGVLFKRSSTPGASLCWSLSPRKLNDSAINELANKLSFLIGSASHNN